MNRKPNKVISVPKGAFTLANDEFRALLKVLRTKEGLSQSDLARRLGLPQSYVSKYETGERRLDFVETVQVCEALGIGIQKFASDFAAKLGLGKTGRSKGGRS
jgi:transcriptional regulator with XRE-family HTH domain